MTTPVDQLIARSNRLGADPRNTNYAGGNTSAKGDDTDPVTGRPLELLWVKGSGGDLGTLTAAGLAILRMDRLRSLVDVYAGVEHEDDMVAAFDYCLHGRGGAAPSIDTAMHGLIDADHVDHLHPDSGIALATAVDGEALTKQCFGKRVGWIPWRRPGFQLGLEIAAIKRDNPEAIGCILGGHGITAWGDTSDSCEANSLEIIRSAEGSWPSTAAANRSALRSPDSSRCPAPNDAPAPPNSPQQFAAWHQPIAHRSGTSPTPQRYCTSSPRRSWQHSPGSAPRAPITFFGPRSVHSSWTCRQPRRSTR